MARAVIALVVTTVCCLGTEAAAQETQRGVSVSADVTTTLDSNVARSDAALAKLRGIRPGDEITTPSVSLDANLPMGRQQFYFGARIGYDFYARNHILNSEDISFHGGLRGHIWHCDSDFHSTYTRAQTQLQNLSIAVTRNIEDLGLVGLDATCGRPIGLAPTVSVSESWSNNSAAQLLPSDFRSFSANFGIKYRRPAFGELSLLGIYQKTDYPDVSAGLAPLAGQVGFQITGAKAQYLHRVGTKIDLAASLGYERLRPDAALLQPFSGAIYDADVNYHPSHRLNFHASLRHTVDPSDRPDTTYAINSDYGLDVRYEFDPRLRLSLGVTDERSDFHGARLIPGIDLRSQAIDAVFGRLEFRVGRRINLILDAREERERANLAIYNYDDTRVGLTVSARL